MATRADMRARCLAELRRADLSAQVDQAIATAISEYQNSRFRFSDIDPAAPPTFTTVPGQAIYSATECPEIATLKSFDYVILNVNNTLYYLYQQDVVATKLYNEIGPEMMGIPDCFSYEGDKLILSPIPNQAWQCMLGIWQQVAAPVTDAEANNPWMNKGELLIRSRVKFEIATHVTRNAAMAQAMSPDPPNENGGIVGQAWRAWRTLKGEAARATTVGNRVKPMVF